MFEPGAKTALVLGAGGPVGHAFHCGVLAALHAHGWDPRTADLIIGTSAGAQVGALVRAGMSPDDLVHRVCGTPMTAAGEAIARHFVRPDYRRPTAARRWLPAAPRVFARDALRPWRWHPGRLLASLLPEGRIELDVQVAGFRNIFGTRWPDRHLWIPALSLRSGSCVTFGRLGSPETCVGTAVACSGAVPSVCKPLRVGRDRFVDGGVVCATHVALAAEADVDTVVVVSPLSMFSVFRHQLRQQVRRLRRRGLAVMSFEPRGEVLRHMGWNPMDLARAPAVTWASRDMAARQLAGDQDLR